ncbi:hypothetical protein BS47DRAFT_1346456 [Hydnum rufescens UP504]|uniref:Uncharacterized protein n=1 Tax=Hydnum rufescens UP504 TaxID=1448309 RepID=A0A9P6ATE8_9AGAM|nr:hypothetical protein BS47DRAFT_1346456 [Hydnum rufescens UP504]
MHRRKAPTTIIPSSVPHPLRLVLVWGVYLQTLQRRYKLSSRLVVCLAGLCTPRGTSKPSSIFPSNNQPLDACDPCARPSHDHSPYRYITFTTQSV